MDSLATSPPASNLTCTPIASTYDIVTSASAPVFPKELIAAGRYLDTFEKRDGVWKITHRKAVFDWNRLVDDMAIPSRPEMEAVMTYGEQGKNDASYKIFEAL